MVQIWAVIFTVQTTLQHTHNVHSHVLPTLYMYIVHVFSGHVHIIHYTKHFKLVHHFVAFQISPVDSSVMALHVEYLYHV